MKPTKLLINSLIFCACTSATTGWAGGIPLTSDDPNLEAAINSSTAVLDVLGNDDSGISNDNFKEVVGLCDIGTSDELCTSNSYSNATGSVSINGAGDDNNVLFTSNSTSTAVFDFKYVMQNSANNTGAAVATVGLNFIEVNSLSDASNNGCDGNECTLREAFDYAVTDLVPTTVKFQRNLSGTIALISPLSVTSIDLSVIGPGAGTISLSGNDSFRVLLIPGMSERFFMSGLTIMAGRTTGADSGAGILIDGATDTRLENMRISDNDSADSGGGLSVINAGLSLINSEISHNSAGSNGGGLAISGGLGSDVTVENTTISNNQSQGQSSGIYINSNNGQNVTLRYVTSAFNTGAAVSDLVGPNGNIIIESSAFTPLLWMQNNSNIVNNSVIESFSGNILGNNNLLATGDLQLSPLIELNNAGVRVHTFLPNSILYNHVDSMIGNAGCGTQVTGDQVGNPRPNEGACDAGAYEYNVLNDLIFASNFD